MIFTVGGALATYYSVLALIAPPIGISAAHFQKLSEEHGVTKSALKSFFKILQQEQVPPEDLDSKLREIAKSYKVLQTKLRSFESGNLQVLALKQRASEFLDEGDFDKAEQYLQQAWEQELAAIKARTVGLHTQQLSASATAAELGELKLTQLAYTAAAEYFREAANHIPKDHTKQHALYLTQEGRAWWHEGKYDEALKPLKQALMIREAVLGSEHPDTISSVHNLAKLYHSQGRFEEAKPLYVRTRSVRERVLGTEHPDTLSSVNDLAVLYSNQGRYAEAQVLFHRALEARERVLGKEHPDTLSSVNDLARLFSNQGRYGEAESLFRRALEFRERVLGKEHPETLSSVSDLAVLWYSSQGRYQEAEALIRRALRVRERILGEEHPETLSSVNDLAVLYLGQGRYPEAEDLLRRALNIRERVLGGEHPETLGSVNDLAVLYSNQGRYGQAESLFRRALEVRERVLGEEHPQTIGSVNNLAGLYTRQNRLGEAEALYQRALSLRKRVLGQAHPHTLLTQEHYTVSLVRMQKIQKALKILKHMEPDLSTFAMFQLQTTSSQRARRQIVSGLSNFQNLVFSLATNYPSTEFNNYAGDVLLRWKRLQADEDFFIAQLFRTADDPHLKRMGLQVQALRSRLSRLFNSPNPNPSELRQALHDLDVAEGAVAARSRHYKLHLASRKAQLNDVRAQLPPGSALIEFRQYRPFNFKTLTFGEPHFLALLLAAERIDGQALWLTDLGPVSESLSLWQSLRLQFDPEVAQNLYQKIFGQLDGHLQKFDPLYVAPDGFLNFTPLFSLMMPDGRYWFERQRLSQVQTGRDLLTRQRPVISTGLLALGDMDYDSYAPVVSVPSRNYGPNIRGPEPLIPSFRSLYHSGPEVTEIAHYYSIFTGEKSMLWRGADASEGRLKGMSAPPRVSYTSPHTVFTYPIRVLATNARWPSRVLPSRGQTVV